MRDVVAKRRSYDAQASNAYTLELCLVLTQRKHQFFAIDAFVVHVKNVENGYWKMSAPWLLIVDCCVLVVVNRSKVWIFRHMEPITTWEGKRPETGSMEGPTDAF